MINLGEFKHASLEAGRKLALPVCDDQSAAIAELVPIGEWALSDDLLLSEFTRWRNTFMRFFLTRFKATNDGTRRYLRDVAIASDDRILFALYSRKRLMGHLGLCNLSEHQAELDNVIRGVSGEHSKLMYFAEKALLEWTFDVLGVQVVLAQVMSNNFLAMSLHEPFGFSLRERFALKKIENVDLVKFVPCPIDEATEKHGLDLIELCRDEFLKARDVV